MLDFKKNLGFFLLLLATSVYCVQFFALEYDSTSQEKKRVSNRLQISWDKVPKAKAYEIEIMQKQADKTFTNLLTLTTEEANFSYVFAYGDYKIRIHALNILKKRGSSSPWVDFTISETEDSQELFLTNAVGSIDKETEAQPKNTELKILTIFWNKLSKSDEYEVEIKKKGADGIYTEFMIIQTHSQSLVNEFPYGDYTIQVFSLNFFGNRADSSLTVEFSVFSDMQTENIFVGEHPDYETFTVTKREPFFRIENWSVLDSFNAQRVKKSMKYLTQIDGKTRLVLEAAPRTEYVRIYFLYDYFLREFKTKDTDVIKFKVFSPRSETWKLQLVPLDEMPFDLYKEFTTRKNKITEITFSIEDLKKLINTNLKELKKTDQDIDFDPDSINSFEFLESIRFIRDREQNSYYGGRIEIFDFEITKQNF